MHTRLRRVSEILRDTAAGQEEEDILLQKDGNGNTALHHAQSLEVARALVEAITFSGSRWVWTTTEVCLKQEPNGAGTTNCPAQPPRFLMRNSSTARGGGRMGAADLHQNEMRSLKV